MANKNTNRAHVLLDPGVFGSPATIQRVFDEATVATGGSANAQVSETLSHLNQELMQLQTLSQAQTDSTRENTKALTQTVDKAPAGSSTLETIGQVAQNVFGVGLGISPLLSGLVSLFGGGGGDNADEPVALTHYVPPSRVGVSAGVSQDFPGQAFRVDYGQGNKVRPVETAAPASAPMQVTVQVQAMDSQSFLDRSTDIALAVRQAMLESSILNDVIREI